MGYGQNDYDNFFNITLSLLSKMNVLIISGPNSQRAGVVAFDLLKNFKRAGHNSNLLNIYYPQKDEDIYSMHSAYSWFVHRAKEKIKRGILKNNQIKTDPNYCFFDIDEGLANYSLAKITKRIKFNPDVIIICFSHKFINTKILYELYSKFKVPILWYLMDMSPFTGGCHYAWDCKGYEKACGACPALYSSDKLDISFRNLQFKKKYIRKIDLTIVAGTEWLYQQAKKSSIFKNKEIFKILLGVDNKIFMPIDRKIARERLNLPTDKKIIFLGSVSLSEKRKGWAYLLEALHHLKPLLLKNHKDANVHLLIAGNNCVDLLNKIPFNYSYLGFLNSKKLPLAYQAADLFISPSIEDSGPMMINQSIMCGTPVVSFEIGVALDIVHNNYSGYRAQLRNSRDLALGMYKLINLDKKEMTSISNNCRAMGLRECHPDTQINKIIDIINHVYKK